MTSSSVPINRSVWSKRDENSPDYSEDYTYPTTLAEDATLPSVRSLTNDYPSSSWTPGQLTSPERRHYNRALKEMYKIVKISSERVETADETLRTMTPTRKTRPVDRDTSATHMDYSNSPNSTQQLYGDYMHQSSYHNTHVQRLRSKRNESHPIEGASNQVHLQDVYAELNSISKRLQKENEILNKRENEISVREQELYEREHLLEEREELNHLHDTSRSSIQKEISRRWKVLQEEHKTQLQEMECLNKEKNKEIKRLKVSFDTLKQANDLLRNQLTNAQEMNNKFESQANNLQRRLQNLLKKQEYGERVKDVEKLAAKEKAGAERIAMKDMKEGIKAQAKPHKPSAGVYDVLGTLLDWICEAHLRFTSIHQQPLDNLQAISLAKDKCSKILPQLVAIISHLPSTSTKVHLPCLQFFYWSLLQIESQEPTQRASLSSTYRRLGEELYKPSLVRTTDAVVGRITEKPKTGCFFKSSSIHTRFLSCLILLQTLTQVDHLAQVFDVLRSDLKEDRCKEQFMHYHATPIFLSYLRASNKTLSGLAVDVYLQMATESVVLQPFLESCSSEVWFRSCLSLLKSPGLEHKLMEKLSIILQKLSKNRSNKRLFDVLGYTSTINGLIHSCSKEDAFLALNFRSILFNLNINKMPPPPQA